MRPRMLWLTSTLSTLSRLISNVRRLMNPVLWTTRKLVTSVSVVQRWNQALALQYSAAIAATAEADRHSRTMLSLTAERDKISSAHWLNTAPSRRAAGYRRYNAPCIQPQLPLRHTIPPGSGDSWNPLLAPSRAAMYTRPLARALQFPRGSHYLSSWGMHQSSWAAS